MASLSEHAELINAAVKAAEKDGFTVEATACCCGSGLVIYKGDFAWDSEAIELDVA